MAEDRTKLQIFISHSHDDYALAKAIQDAFSATLGEKHIEVDYSSRTDEGGIGLGQSWLEWIYDKIQRNDLTLLLLTPASANKPWLMWEAGAVTGVGMGPSKSDKSGRVIPMLFRLVNEDIPSPLRTTQGVRGDTREGMTRLLSDIVQQKLSLPEPGLKSLVTPVVDRYMETITEALKDRPPKLDEPAVQEWLERIDRFERSDRRSEIDHLRRAIEIAFGGREANNENAIPLDVRLHRRFGEIYLANKSYDSAVEQFELAHRLMPRDIFLLHRLGLAYLGQKNRPQAEEMLKRILSLDPTAAEHNSEIAGFKGRYYREKWESDSSDRESLRTARDAYRANMRLAPTSYFVADNVGQLSILLDERNVADEAFRFVRKAIAESKEQNVWSKASHVTSTLYLDGIDAAIIALTELMDSFPPTPGERASIRKGIERMCAGMSLSRADEAKLLDPLA